MRAVAPAEIEDGNLGRSEEANLGTPGAGAAAEVEKETIADLR